jgi:hypothetical protein
VSTIDTCDVSTIDTELKTTPTCAQILARHRHRRSKGKDIIRAMASAFGRLLDYLPDPDDSVERAIRHINHPGVSADYYRARAEARCSNERED